MYSWILNSGLMQLMVHGAGLYLNLYQHCLRAVVRFGSFSRKRDALRY